MTAKITFHRFFQLIFIALLAACGTLTPKQLVKGTPTSALESATPLGSTGAHTLLPSTPLPTISLFPTLTPANPPPTPLPAVLPKFPLDGYVKLYIKDWVLYFQDGNNTPVKLTQVEKSTEHPYSPKLSDDNQKVVFAQENGSKIYSINTDGTRKRVVLSNDRLSSFDSGTRIDTVNFVPHTHLLFFVIVQCNLQQINSPCPTGDFLVDTDTGDIKKIGDFTGTIKVSPDGKMLAVGAMDGMKIFTLDGRLMRDDILPYTPSQSDISFPTLSWLPDSSGLIVAIPDKTYNTLPCGPLPAHSIWRYTLAGNTVVQIPLEPPPMAYTIAVSPDGNWIAYGGFCQPLLYLGNLVTGQTQVFDQDDTRPSFSWSSDSKHLIIHYSALLTSLDKPSIHMVSGSIWWLDANHFGNVIESYISFNKFHDRNMVGEIRGDEIFYYEQPEGDFIPIIMKAKR